MQGIYRFNDFVVDSRSHRVTQDGREIAIEPKAFALLLVLLEHAGEMVSRQDLLDRVWTHSYVTPATLNRIIAVLRRALSDDADLPRYIETVHGLGYRFVAPVIQAPASESKPGIPTDEAIAPSPALNPSRNTSARWMRFAGIAALTIAFSIAMFFALRERSAPRVEERASQSPRMAVLPFSVAGDDAALRATTDGLAESLIEVLSRVPGLNVTGRESAFALDRDSDVQQAMNDLGVAYALHGDALTRGDQVQLHYALWRRGDASPVWLDEQTVARAEMFRVLVPVSERIRATLAPASAIPHPLDVAIPAQDLYWLGRHYSFERTPAALARALGYFERATKEDPDFALAYCGLADSYMLLSEYGNVDLDEAASKARAAIARARSISPSLPEAMASEGLILLDENRFDDAVAALATAVAHPLVHPSALLWYGNALAYSGRPREAKVWHLKAAQDDPLNTVLQTYLGVDSLIAGNEKNAETYFQRAIELNPDYIEAYWQIAWQHQLYGRFGEAVRTYRQADRRQPNNGWTALYLADAYLRAGDVASARATLQKSAAISPAERIDVASMLAIAEGQPANVMSDIDKYREHGAAAHRVGAVRARTLALAGREEEARTIYSDIFAATIERGDTLYRLWMPDLSLSHFANWLTLLPQDSDQRRRGLAALSNQLDQFQSGGVDLPVMHYQRAMLAALRGEEATIQEELETAQRGGWIDFVAFDRDLVWRRYAAAPWLRDRRESMQQRTAAERALF
jgi:DNA-binding winged helix-turn-helix (wHTH) protein/TolB-like protein/Flp pilus assembly protein TadD